MGTRLKRGAGLILGYAGAVASASVASTALILMLVPIYGAIERPAPYRGLAWASGWLSDRCLSAFSWA